MTEADPPPAVDPPAPAATVPSPVVSGRLRRLRERVAADVVLAAEVGEFLSSADWEAEGDEAVCRLGPRWCRVAREQVTLGHDSWPGSKRIPL